MQCECGEELPADGGNSHPDFGELCDTCYALNPIEEWECDCCGMKFDESERQIMSEGQVLCERCMRWVKKTNRLVNDVVAAHKPIPRQFWTYPTLLMVHMTKKLLRRGMTSTADGTRAVVVFSPRDAGEMNETNNAPQRYEVIVRPLADKEVNNAG
jgi:hypothetical protein